MDARRRGVVAVVVCYALVAIVVTYPLVWNIRTTFPGLGDDVYGFIWNNWWIHHAVVELGQLPYFTDAIFAPFNVDLRLHTLGLLYGLISIPVTATLGPVGALNLQIFATIVLNGYSMFRLVAHLTRDTGAAFVAGLILATTPAITFHLGVGRPSCAAVWPAIFALLALLRLVASPGWRSSIWLAVWLVATILTDQQVALFGGCWLAILATAELVRRRPGELVRWGAVALILAAAPAWMLYSGFLGGEEAYGVPASSEALRYSYPVRLFWTPSMVWNVYGIVLPVALVLVVTSISWRSRALSRTQVNAWLIGSLIFLTFSLGPVAMGTSFPLPYQLVQWLPGFDQFRTPYRFQIPAAIGFAVLTGLLISHGARLAGSRRARWLAAGVLVIATADIVAHRVVDGFPLRAVPHEPAYEEIALDERDRLVLEIPFGVRTGIDKIGRGETLTIFQPIHQNRLMNGFLARAPLAALEYYRGSPAIMFLAQEAPMRAEVPSDLQQKVRDLNVGYVVIHPEMLEADRLKDTVALIEGLEGVQRLETSSGVIAFRVE